MASSPSGAPDCRALAVPGASRAGLSCLQTRAGPGLG